MEEGWGRTQVEKLSIMTPKEAELRRPMVSASLLARLLGRVVRDL